MCSLVSRSSTSGTFGGARTRSVNWQVALIELSPRRLKVGCGTERAVDRKVQDDSGHWFGMARTKAPPHPTLDHEAASKDAIPVTGRRL